MTKVLNLEPSPHNWTWGNIEDIMAEPHRHSQSADKEYVDINIILKTHMDSSAQRTICSSVIVLVVVTQMILLAVS